MEYKHIEIANYTYDLPTEKIAAYPLENRVHSKLLVYKNGRISEDVFFNISNYFPSPCTLILNESKVIPARLNMTNQFGGRHEIFCLERLNDSPSGEIWKCMAKKIGSKLDRELHVEKDGITCNARILEKIESSYIIEFSWSPKEMTFIEVLSQVGELPIPPYLKRPTESIDEKRYQTTYAKQEGSVAAPTAGLHYTPEILSTLEQRNTQVAKVSLHVGAGTFKPVKSDTMEGHNMHFERMEVSIETIQIILHSLQKNTPIICVGTTSLRTIESLYWMGVKCLLNIDSNIQDLEVTQWDAYELPQDKSNIEAISALQEWMKSNQMEQLFCATQLLILPNYDVKIAQAITTNFHQPNSTLLLLVASIVKDKWSEIYDYALSHDFRFLSYGDTSLLFTSK